MERFLRPGAPEAGFSYTFAGGYLDAPFAFDPAPFGISPREAQQMDPQQRLLLEVSWRAFEDAGIAPSSLAGKNVGVYIGASTVDYQSGASHDPAVMGSHFMTGNSLSILSNRLSYIFDLKGPSLTVDSACSSSLVALCEAMKALQAGEIEMALVGGVNLLLSPLPFIGFSQARMLSPTGVSRPFSQEADGYVRSEGAVVLLLRLLPEARARGERVRSIIMGAATNSDGRTAGISLPSLDGQQRLIQGLYENIGLAPEALAFVEAHGTGTKVGDPIEAAAIGQTLGRVRSRPLPIGSVKSNIGHLEAASGLAGLLKASLALEHRLLPRSLFCDVPNEKIDFQALNLTPAQRAVALEPFEGRLVAGICNYGFGGTNAHVILRADDRAVARSSVSANSTSSAPRLFMISAASKPALAARATQIGKLLADDVNVDLVAGALAHQQETFSHRLVIPMRRRAELPALLGAFHIDGEATGIAAQGDRKTTFVFSGNGCQFSEMGRAAYKLNPSFRREIDDIDRLFKPLAGWSIANSLAAGIPEDRLELTSVSQPLIFAIQSALIGCLAEFGIRPDAVIGHSVGEVAAAEACGALTRAEALRLIFLRSKHQEAARGRGHMLVVAADETVTRAELARIKADDIDIAALNSPTSTTFSGPSESLQAFANHCRRQRLATVDLGIDYPFHSRALDDLAPAMLADLAGLSSRPGHTPFYSAVTGGLLSGDALGPTYWWDNIRRPVLFEKAVTACLDGGTTAFVEIGPRPILAATIKDLMRGRGLDGQSLPTLSTGDGVDLDPIETILARLVAEGVSHDVEAVFGPRPQVFVPLPGYPFQQQDFTLPHTPEGLSAFGYMSDAEPRHPLIGARMADGSPEWRSLVDTVLVPYLADHQVDGGVIVPAAAMIEIAFAAGRDLFGAKPLEIDPFDILKPLILPLGETRELSTRFSQQTSSIEIWSRKRLSSSEDWILHARGCVHESRGSRLPPLAPPALEGAVHNTPAEVYAEAGRAGLAYGPCFQLVTSLVRDRANTVFEAQLREPEGGLGAYQDLHVLHPASLDAAFHGLFIQRPQRDGEMKAHLPIRFRRTSVLKHNVPIRRAVGHLLRETDRSRTFAMTFFGADGEVVASVEAAVLRAVHLSKPSVADRSFHEITVAAARHSPVRERPHLTPPTVVGPTAQWLLTRAFCVSLAHETLGPLGGAKAQTVDALIASGRLAPEAAPYVEVLVAALVEFGAAERSGESFTLSPAVALPDAQTLLNTILQRFPAATFEARMAALALANAASLLRTGTFLSASPAMLQRLASGSALAQPALAALEATIAEFRTARAGRLHLLVVEPFSQGLARVARNAMAGGDLDITFASSRRDALDAFKPAFADASGAHFLLLDEHGDSAIRFDALLSHTTALPKGYDALLTRAATLLRENAPCIFAIPGADTALNVLCGLWRDWSTRRTPHASQLASTLASAGLADVETHALPDGLGSLLVATRQARSSTEAPTVALLRDDEAPWLRTMLSGARDIHDLSLPALFTWLAEQGEDATPTIVVAPLASRAPASDQLARRIDLFRRLLAGLSERGQKVRVFATTIQGPGDMDGVQAALDSGVHAFIRVAINEYPQIDLRLLAIEAGASQALTDILEAPGLEREWIAAADGPRVTRVRRGMDLPSTSNMDERSCLQFDHPGRLDAFSWVTEPRCTPGADEIEIEVVAIGLNFRDVLVGLGVLDDDLLGAGLTAASLGFECSGRVIRVGSGVTHVAAGDSVMGFGAGVFTSHMKAPAWQFFKTPKGMSLEAAATIPVAFATAWYGLVHRGQLRAGETVLIHGAAGGVGLAGVQIARHIGARVIGTASDPARRAIARAAGADLLFDSRQERFADAIAREIGGVDVVLNSLAGPAMQASFQLLKPFGRFVELGKRDFLDNGQLGLRPFVRNIAYSGVDLDELLAHDRGIVSGMMTTLSDLFASGVLHALPHQVYEAHEISEAFRSMQGSEHVGKIVVRPSLRATRDVSSMRFSAREGLYLIVGGTAGLGFETARWLARNGATTLVLASRRGILDMDLQVAVDAMRATGIRVVVEQLDVRKARAVQDLVGRITSQFGPLRGVVHAALHLDDGLIASLEEERVREGLATKVEGVLNLDRATADQPLDFFVAYSSATTVIGSPGQGVYVAANGFLEGWARQRRAAGKPAMAIGWGAISDVGMIARDRQLGERLRRTTGVVGIRSAEALAHLGCLLAMGPDADPVQFYTNISPSSAADKLCLLKSPAFAELGLAMEADNGEEGGDLVSLIAGKDRGEALDLITRALAREVATILRMPEADVNTARPLGELGLDSLMGLELHLGVERLSGMQMPMIGASDRRLVDIAATILSHLTVGDVSGDSSALDQATARAMAEAHAIDAIPEDQIDDFKRRLEKVGGRSA